MTTASTLPTTLTPTRRLHGKADRGVSGEELDMEGGAGLEWVVNSGMGGKMAWAGPSHWRFKAPPRESTGAATRRGRGEDGKPKKREKGELTYDFENPGEIDEARFTLAATIEELQLVSAPVAVDTLLPPDLGYDASQLVKLSLRPNVGVAGGWRWLGGPAAAAKGARPGYDDDAGFGGGFETTTATTWVSTTRWTRLWAHRRGGPGRRTRAAWRRSR